MQFLKKHYEKVILSVVLLGLAAAAGGLWLEVGKVSQFLEDTETGLFVKATPKAFKPVNLSTNEAVVKRLTGPIKFQYTEAHNLVNPVPWIKKGNGGLIKVDSQKKIGPGALLVTRIHELILTVSFDGIVVGEKTQFKFTVSNDKDPGGKKARMVSSNRPKNDLFTLLEAKGPADAPTEFILVLKGEKGKDEPIPITVTKEKPYTRIVGYSADLKYPPENHVFTKHFRAKDSVQIPKDSEIYKIVAITYNQVVLSADSTGKRTILNYDNSPQAKADIK